MILQAKDFDQNLVLARVWAPRPRLARSVRAARDPASKRFDQNLVLARVVGPGPRLARSVRVARDPASKRFRSSVMGLFGPPRLGV